MVLHKILQNFIGSHWIVLGTSKSNSTSQILTIFGEFELLEMSYCLRNPTVFGMTPKKNT